MSLDQGPEVLLEGSKRDSDYQTVSKLDKLVVESSGSTRRIQRAQEHQIPTFLSQKIIRRTFHDQGVQYRSSVHNHSLFPRIYRPCHSRKTINRAPFHLEKRPKLEGIKRETEDRSCLFAPPRPPPDHRLKALSFVGPPVEGPTLRRTTSRRPYTSPDHQLKALHFAGPPVEGPTLRSRPEVLPKDLRSRPEVLTMALRSA
ncbi:hypothetical protein M5K25_009427 [Dendrobium thyrsiflorum]|uniref:Uncharacterized protein n=1 Tax=Dendrobium thyrsiflorum TaxID=117978 RepID=A0ABD0VCR1_DENTH